MKSLETLALMGLLVAPLWAGGPPPTPTPAVQGPRITVEPQVFDFGPALQNKTLSKEFTIKNFGTADLVIERVTTTCGCTTAPLEEKSKVIKPGGSTPLRVSLQTRESTGLMSRSVLIKSNDAEKGLYEIKVQATVAAAGKAP